MKNSKKKLFIASVCLILILTIVLAIVYTKTKKQTNMMFSAKYIESDISSIELGLKPIEEEKIGPEYAEGQAIIMLNNNVKTFSNKSVSNSILNELEIEKLAEVEANDSKNLLTLNSMQKINKVSISLVKSEEYTTEELIEKLQNEGIYAEPNCVMHTTDITNDTYLSQQWAIENNGHNGGTEGLDINPISTTSDKEKVIAIIDSGVDYTHSDLKDVMWNNPYKDSVDLPGAHGYDFGDNDTEPMDNNGHGTHCAGIIGAQSNNQNGITGAILGNSNIKIMALKIQNKDGKMYLADAINAYDYIRKAIDKGINVVAINNSWGEYYNNSEVESLKAVIETVGKKGALSICAAGNESKNTDSNNHVPSGIDSDYIISVASSNVSDKLSDFSNYGSTTVDIAAPGSNILSTVPYNVFNPSIYTENERDNICSTYENFEDISDLKFKYIGGNVSTCQSQYFGSDNKKSLKWSIDADVENKYYFLCLPMEITSDNQFFSIMMNTYSTGAIVYLYYYPEKIDDLTQVDLNSLGTHYFGYSISGEETQWTNLKAKVGNSQEGTLLIILKASSTGNHTIYIDDFAISSASASESDFGKYDFYNGTSMAAPFVTAAVGTITNKYNEDNPLNIKDKLFQAVRKSSNLTSKVATGGVLDLSKLPEEVIIPTLDLSTNEANSIWSNIDAIPLQNTIVGRTYQYTIDGGSSWIDCVDNKVVLTNGDGTYQIKVRQKDCENSSDTYYYKLDTTIPELNVTPSQVTEKSLQITPNITVNDASSGVKNTSIEYVFSTSTTAPEAYQTANLTNGEVTLISPNNANGTYYLYIKPIEDNATNKSNSDIHKFGPYELTNTITVTGVTLNATNLTMYKGERNNTLKATITPNNATNKNVVWTSSNSNIVKVDSSTGELTAVEAGNATIIVTTEDGSKKASCEVLVEKRLVVNTNYVIEETEEANYIYIPYTTEEQEIKNNIETNGELTIKSTQHEGDIAKTGNEIKILFEGQEKIYKVVVRGDINGDGKVNGTDLFMLSRYQVQYSDALTKVIGEYKKAANVYNKDTEINGNDLYKLARVLVQMDEL